MRTITEPNKDYIFDQKVEEEAIEKVLDILSNLRPEVVKTVEAMAKAELEEIAKADAGQRF